MSNERPTLQRVVVLRISVVFSLMIIVGSLILIYGLDRQLHEQTDLMLAQLVKTEADGVLREFDDGLHVHDANVSLPSIQGTVAEKYALVYGPDCRVRASTHNVDIQRIPESQCDTSQGGDDTWAFDTTELTERQDVRLRAVAHSVISPDRERLVFISALDHAIIDASIAQGRRAILIGGVLLLIAVVVSSLVIARGITREVESLSRAAETIETTATRLTNQDVSNLFEISERTPAEIAHLAETLEALMSKLQRLLVVQNRFIAEAAHELRTPLTALQGELEVTLRRERSSEEYRGALERALGDSRRLSDLAESLLEAARTQSDDVITSPVRLVEVVDDAIDRHRQTLSERGISVEAAVDDSTRVVADELALSRVLDNLLSNVASHSEASDLRISVEDLGGSSDYVGLHIRDDGRGLPDDVSSSLFVPLKSGRDGGHGLGLYIAYKLAAKQTGRLEHIPEESGTHWRLCLKRA